MNKSPIEWCDYTWNPITGCLHGCQYCYARRFAARGMGRYELTEFRPTFHTDRLVEPAKVKKPSRIFVGSMSDLLGTWDWMWMNDNDGCYGGTGAPSGLEICEQIARAMEAAPQHTYIILTKADLSSPVQQQKARLLIDAGAWLGVSVTGDVNKSEEEAARINALAALGHKRSLISFEPIMGLSLLTYHAVRNYATGTSNEKLGWLIIGGLTPKSKLTEYQQKEERYDASSLAEICAEHGVPCFLKDNLGFPIKSQEYPEEMETEATP